MAMFVLHPTPIGARPFFLLKTIDHDIFAFFLLEFAAGLFARCTVYAWTATAMCSKVYIEANVPSDAVWEHFSRTIRRLHEENMITELRLVLD